MNGYVKAVLALEAVRRKREERYDRFGRPLDRKRDVLSAEVDRRMRALIGAQQAEARGILGAINGGGTFKYKTEGFAARIGHRGRVPLIRTASTQSSSARTTRAARGAGTRAWWRSERDQADASTSAKASGPTPAAPNACGVSISGHCPRLHAEPRSGALRSYPEPLSRGFSQRLHPRRAARSRRN